MSEDYLDPIPAPIVSSGFTSSDGADVTLDGQDFASPPRLDGAPVGARCDAMVARVGRGYIILGSGGYRAPVT